VTHRLWLAGGARGVLKVSPLMAAPSAAAKTIALVGRAADSRVGEAMRVLAEHLAGAGHTVRSLAGQSPDFGAVPVDQRSDATLVPGCDLVVAIGGDGTMLHAARLAAVAGAPVLGVNRGRLGFLADVGPERMRESVDEALAGRCLPEARMLLEAIVPCEGRPTSALALNDVAAVKRETGRMLDLHTWVDGIYVNTHGGDGFIVATSTGSTAYALSCGGPIVHPSLAALVLVPICPHTLSDRPIVVGAGSVVELELAERIDTRAQVVCDGVVLCDLEPGVRLSVRRADAVVTLLHPPGHDYYRILRSKLHWGRGARDGRTPAR
jgi:NAD+ kinase